MTALYPWAYDIKVKQEGNETISISIPLQEVEVGKYNHQALENHSVCFHLIQEDV